MQPQDHIFRNYDIRGIYGKDLDEEIAEKIGNAFASFVESDIVIGMDMRNSSEGLKKSFIKGALQAGKNIIDVGLTPRGATIYYGWKASLPTAYISASHLPKEWNGIKFTDRKGVGFSSENEKIKKAVMSGEMKNSVKGKIKNTEVIEDYINYIVGKIQFKTKMKVLVDCGNGAASIVMRKLMEKLSIDSDFLYEELDGTFPNRESEISDHVLSEAKKRAVGYDVTMAFDGDADRLLLIDEKGRTLDPEVIAYLILTEISKKEKGPVVATVECSKILDKIAQKFGKDVFRTKVGYTHMIQGIIKTNACLGLEKSGHFCVPSIMAVDDGISTSILGLKAIENSGKKLSEIADEFPRTFRETAAYDCDDRKKFVVMESLVKKIKAEFKNTNTLDGISAETGKGWVLIRVSNTSPIIRLTVESETKADFKKIKKQFERILSEEIKNH